MSYGLKENLPIQFKVGCTEEELGRLERQWKESPELINAIKQYLELELEKNRDASDSKTNYQCPNYQLDQADYRGERRANKNIQNIINKGKI